MAILVHSVKFIPGEDWSFVMLTLDSIVQLKEESVVILWLERFWNKTRLLLDSFPRLFWPKHITLTMRRSYKGIANKIHHAACNTPIRQDLRPMRNTAKRFSLANPSVFQDNSYIAQSLFHVRLSSSNSPFCITTWTYLSTFMAFGQTTPQPLRWISLTTTSLMASIKEQPCVKQCYFNWIWQRHSTWW